MVLGKDAMERFDLLPLRDVSFFILFISLNVI